MQKYTTDVEFMKSETDDKISMLDVDDFEGDEYVVLSPPAAIYYARNRIDKLTQWWFVDTVGLMQKLDFEKSLK
jgi:hypothetical protein